MENNKYRFYKIKITKSTEWEAYIRYVNFYNINDLKTYVRVTAGNGGSNPMMGCVNGVDFLYRTDFNAGKINDWICFEFDESFSLTSFNFEQLNSNCNNFTNFILMGSKDGENFEDLLEYCNIPTSVFDSSSQSPNTNFNKLKLVKTIVNIEELKDDRIIIENNYQKNIECSPNVCIILGSNTALVIDNAVNFKFKYGIEPLITFLEYYEKVLTYYQKIINFTPNPNRISQKYGKNQLIEVSWLNAGGLAGHGTFGIAVGPHYLEETYEKIFNNEKVLHQIFYYETFRNFINPDVFTPCFDYMTKQESCYGWVNQGFVNIVGCLLCKDLDLEFNYYGTYRDKFMEDMEKVVEEFISKKIDWNEGVGKHHLLPYNKNHSIDNYWSGLISILYRHCGGSDFLQEFFKNMVDYGIKRGGPNYDKYDQNTARKNFIDCVYKSNVTNSTSYIDKLFSDIGFIF